MILSNLLETCLLSVCAGVILGLTLIVLAVITYFVASIISSIFQTFKDVRAKHKANKIMKALDNFNKALEDLKEQKTDSR